MFFVLLKQVFRGPLFIGIRCEYVELDTYIAVLMKILVT